MERARVRFFALTDEIQKITRFSFNRREKFIQNAFYGKGNLLMSTTLSSLIYEIGELGLSNPRLSSNFLAWCNRAQREICERRNFSFMHDTQLVTMLAGNNSVSLGTNFKQLAPEKSTISYVNPMGGSPWPCQIISRAVASRYRRYWSFPFYSSTQPYLPPTYIFVESDSSVNNGEWTLYLPPTITAQANITFNVEAYYYPPDFTSAGQSTQFTSEATLMNAFINRVKSIAYYAIDPTDPKGAAAEAIYERYFTKTAIKDALQRQGGRAIHM